MSKTRLFSVLGILICVLCLLGFTSSDYVVLSAYAPTRPYRVPDNVPGWDYESHDINDLGNVRLWNWSSVQNMANERLDKNNLYYIEWNEMVHLIRNNIFWFTRLGICTSWYPGYSEFNRSMGYRRYLDLPNAFILEKLLTEPDQEQLRSEFILRGLELLNDPQTKTRWDEQRIQFLNDNAGRINQTGYQTWRLDYNRIANATYSSSLTAAISKIIEIMQDTDFSRRVLPTTGGAWYMVDVVNNIFDTIGDDSPMGINSICFRMGPAATAKMIGYLTEIKQQLAQQ